ncbi:MAG: M20/M25/M40 family metallo-hydrolase [Clostridia bacterium]|nr:M20/M25/M40 family metallo-hydrolase [Clostridia bacterium]
MKRYDKDLTLLRELSLLFGPSGCEGEVADTIERALPSLCDSYTRDRMGNLIALIRTGDPEKKQRRKVMISAHMDEVGVMVSELCEDGLLRFDTVGGIDVSVLEGRKITLEGACGKISGVIASKAIHHKERKDRNKPTPMAKLFIDIGARDRAEAEGYVSVGSFGTFDSEFYRFGKDGAFVKGKALDDRMGCAAMISVMSSLMGDRPKADLDLYFCFTVREEIGLSGAKVVAQRIAPELAIVLESTAVADLPDTEDAKRVAELGAGGALSVMDRSTIYDRDFLAFARWIAEEQAIPVQLKKYVSGGNDAGSIHKSGVGVRTLALSVPTRYLHSPACVASVSDYHSVTRLVEAMLRSMTPVLP